jgi:predicted nucleic acid-binding Zn ribbon protein
MGEISLQEAMQQFLKNSKFKTYVQAMQVEEVWEKIMGKTVAKYTEKIQVIGSTLYITTNVAPLKNELLYQKETIIQRVNEAMGEQIIKEVIVK